MLVLGIETSCDETGVALFDSAAGLLAQALHSQVDMHQAYGGVVPELASRDHIRRCLPLLDQALASAQRRKEDIDAIAVTVGPGLAGALLVGASVAHGLGLALGKPVVGVHHLEGHLLSPLLSTPAPEFPFVALLVSGGHTQLLRVDAPGEYALLGETLDDAAGEAFDKTAQLLGLGYPGGPAVSRLAISASRGRSSCRARCGTAATSISVSAASRPRYSPPRGGSIPLATRRAPTWRAVSSTRSWTSSRKSRCRRSQRPASAGWWSRAASARTSNCARGSSRLRLDRDAEVFFPPLDLCTDNGAMIALAGLMRLQRGEGDDASGFSVRPRWPLTTLAA